MQFESLNLADLGSEHYEAWGRFRAAAPLDSPLLAPSLLQLVCRCRGDLKVAVARQEGAIAALLPYHASGSVARPCAGPLSDLQAVLCDGAADFDVQEMMSAVGLSALHFHAQLAGQTPLRPFLWKTQPSPFIDVSSGFEAYREERRQAGSDELKEALRKGRKIRRELGEVSFRHDLRDSHVLDQVLAWKGEQLDAVGAFNALRVPWVREVLRDVVELDAPDCQGLQLELRVAGELASAALAVRSGAVLHGWVMAFNPDPKFRKYSVGILLLTELLQQAESLGIRRIDMGSGAESYKRSFQSGAFEVAEGSVDRRRLVGPVRRQLVGIREWLGNSPLRRRLQSWINHRRYSC